MQLEGLEERSSFPSGSGQSPATKCILTHFRPKFAPFCVGYLMQLTDTLSHNIISHKMDTDEPITKAIANVEFKLCPPSLSKLSLSLIHI